MARFQKFLSAALATLALATLALPAFAQIPASERQVLVDLYNNTQGASWTNRSGWLGAAGTECTWFGITCDSGSGHVIDVDLYDNTLVGALPSLSGLTSLRAFSVGNNQLTGTPPAVPSPSALLPGWSTPVPEPFGLPVAHGCELECCHRRDTMVASLRFHLRQRLRIAAMPAPAAEWHTCPGSRLAIKPSSALG